jgi:adenylate kinase family enzyme
MAEQREALLLCGRPGSGKTTLGDAVAEQLGNETTHVSMGNAIRRHIATVKPARNGRKPLLDPTVYMGNLLATARSKLLIIDGYPRTAEQLAFYNRLTNDIGIITTAVCVLEIPDELAIERINARAKRSRNEPSPQKRLQKFHAEEQPVVDAMAALYGAVFLDASVELDSLKSSVLEVVSDHNAPEINIT